MTGLGRWSLNEELVPSDVGSQLDRVPDQLGLGLGLRIQVDVGTSNLGWRPRGCLRQQRGFTAVVSISRKSYDERPLDWTKLYPYRLQILIEKEGGPLKVASSLRNR